MIADLKPFPTYRQAEGGWLGEVPSHWTIRRMKYVVREIDARSTTGKEQLLRISQYTGVTQRRRADGLDEPDTRADSLVGYKRVEPNDLVINIMLAWNGSMGVSRYEGIASPAYCVYRFGRNLRPWYFHNLLRSPAYKARIKASSTGVVESRLRLYSDDLGRIEAMVPPPDEQAAIVRFLDWANGRLERAIRAKRKQLALVRERVLVETERALRGDGVVRKRLSTIAQLMSRPIDRRGDQIYTRIGLYNRGRGIFHKLAVPGTDLGDSEFFSVCPGDFVISGQFAWEGAVALARAKESGCIASHRYPILRGYDGIASSAFLFSFFRSSYGAMLLDHHSRGAAGRNRPLNAQRLLKEEIPVPSRAAQERIEFLLEQEYAVAQSVERMVGVINEYRTRLVADVVTGKLDVREAAARLPDDAPPDTIEDDADLGDEAEAADEEAPI